MMNYNKLNNIVGWLVFGIAAFTYLSTIEPTTSFWDCGEYIATAYKLEVGHPPGAPLFNILGRFFTLFADSAHAAQMVNSLSALMSAFTILFLFWTITALGRKIWNHSGEKEMSTGTILTILGSGIVGALAYTFSDSFWFSAVEGEVYASSSFFTAIVFWAILKWEIVADEKGSDRWIIFIGYMIGLSIGVHLLNLLTIPAIVMVYYFRKYPYTRKGFFTALIIGIFSLGFVQGGLIPGIAGFAAKSELLFVNTFGLPFNSGTIIYFLLIIGAIIGGLRYTAKNNKAFANTLILSFTFLIIGYSTFFTLIIRSQANPPMDENNPENAVTLLSYLNREQYGDWPILYGQYYNAPLDPAQPYKDGKPVYTRDDASGKYIITQDRKNSVPNYDPKFCTIFPRMWDDQGSHVSGYKDWADIKGTPVQTMNNQGEPTTIMRPTFGENLKFFFKYQVGHMYGRYFMWNFVGRQNDLQGHGGILKGNWMSGVKSVDSIRLGNQERLPKSMTSNKGMNRFYFLPLILGLIGLFFHFKKDKSDAFVILLMFIFTGLSIIVYLNNTPYQPRERDYGYVGSFYAFAIWIGLGVYSIQDFLKNKLKNANLSAILATITGLIMAPTLMAKDGWDDHNRSNRYTARDFAYDYLNSCAQNAILFTNGDNDTFPLWYAQEVEGIRTDVRVVNLSLSNTDWYIEQMRRKAYDSDPVPMTLTADKVRQGTRDYVPIYTNPQLGLDTNRFYNIKELLDFIASEESSKKLPTQGGQELNYLPTNKVFIPVDSATVVNNGTVPKYLADKIVKGGIPWTINKSYIMKNDLLIFDILATNNWKRPIYFAITVGDDAYMDLQDYFQIEGLTYRLVPIKNNNYDGQTGRVLIDKMYDNLMNKFHWGGMETPGIYMDENNIRMTMNLRNNFARLAEELLKYNEKEKALKVLDKCMMVMPKENIPYNYFMLPIVECYYKAGETTKGNKLAQELADIYTDDMQFYLTLKGKDSESVDNEKQQCMGVLQRILMMTKQYKQDALNKKIESDFTKFSTQYTRG
jgi:hypothetical protein